MKWLKEIDKKSKLTAALIIMMVVIIYVSFKVTDNFHSILNWGQGTVYWIGKLLKPVIIGFIVAYLLFPLMDKIQKLLERLKFFKKHTKLSKALAILILALAIVGLFTLFIFILISVIRNTITAVSTTGLIATLNDLSGNLTSIGNQLSGKLQELNIDSPDVQEWVNKSGEYVSKYILDVANSFVDLITQIPAIFTNLLFSIIFAIYFLYDGEAILIYWRRILRALLGKKAYGYVKQFANDADTVFSGYIRGQVTDAVFVGCVVSLVFSICKIKYAILIGVLTGVGNLVPYLGPVLGYGTILLTGIIHGDYKMLILALILMFVVQTVDGNIINPKFLSDAIKVHPLLVLLSLIVGGSIGGFLGMLLAVPCGALIKIWFERAVYKIDDNRKKKLQEANVSEVAE